jgi:predicted AAA+ superfamily ATPase
MNETEIMRILVDWNFWGNFKEELIERAFYLSRIEQLFSARTATILFGVRRAGKSSLAYLFVKRLIEKKQIDAKDSLIVNFEDPRFPPALNSNDLLRLYEVYLKNLEPSNPIVVLDEVQTVKGWEKFVRYLLETRKARVLITGSSSKLLGMEISTVLTGRHVDIEIFPLNFKEFLEFKNLKLTSKLELIKHRIKISRLLDEYFEWGGFPEVVLSPSTQRKGELLFRYFDDIVMKDVVKRFGIKEIEKLESLANIYMSNISTLQSFNKLKETVGLSLDTIERFSKYLETARMFLFLKKFEYSVGKQTRSMRKVYTMDPGFYNVKGFKFSENYGKLAENIVATELSRRCSFNPKLEIYYWKDYQQREVDFVIKRGLKVEQLVQVTSVSGFDKIEKREIDSLLKACKELKCKDLLIITKDYEGEEYFNGKKIKIVPLWKWLLV